MLSSRSSSSGTGAWWFLRINFKASHIAPVGVKNAFVATVFVCLLWEEDAKALSSKLPKTIFLARIEDFLRKSGGTGSENRINGEVTGPSLSASRNLLMSHCE